MKTFSFINKKGGVGKTTITVNVAYAIAESCDLRVLVIDNDDQGNDSQFFDADPKKSLADILLGKADIREVIQHTRYPEIDIVASGATLLDANVAVIKDEEIVQQNILKESLEKVAENYDVCLIDNPPTINASVINALIASDEVIIVTTPDIYGIRGVSQMVEYIEAIKEYNFALRFRGCLLNKFSSTPHGFRCIELLKSQFPLFRTRIRYTYVLQFFLAHEYKKITFTLGVADEIFTGSGKMILKQGYKACESVEPETKTVESNIKLPALVIGDKIEKTNYSISNKVTTPPKRFTEGTLLAAMANIWRFVDAKNSNREKLKEVKGIGTPATRDTIIAELQADTMNGKPVEPFMKKTKNELVPTDFGISLIENVDQSLTLPDATAEMEYALSEIAAGQKSLAEYMDEMIAMVHQNIQFAENRKFSLPKGKVIVVCPICGNGELIRRYSPKVKKYFHICSNLECASPVTGRKIFYEDDHGNPVVVKCPDCETILVRIMKNGTFWLCGKCNKTFNDKAGKPDLSSKKK